MNRQQRRAAKRLEASINRQLSPRKQPMSYQAEEAYQAGYRDGWHAALDFAMKTCYAGAVLALHDLEGYGAVRNTRFLRAMDEYITTTLTSEEIIDEALEKAGVKICFRGAFPEDRIEEIVP